MTFVWSPQEYIVKIIIRKFCRAVTQYFQPVFMQTPCESYITSRFEQLHGIPYIIGAINGSHIHVLTLVDDGEDYYCRKSFHSTILSFIIVALIST